MIDTEEIENRFGFPQATEDDNATLQHVEVRLLFLEFAENLNRLAPEGRAKSIMFTELENASMWMHKAIAGQAPAIRETSDGRDA